MNLELIREAVKENMTSNLFFEQATRKGIHDYCYELKTTTILLDKYASPEEFLEQMGKVTKLLEQEGAKLFINDVVEARKYERKYICVAIEYRVSHQVPKSSLSNYDYEQGVKAYIGKLLRVSPYNLDCKLFKLAQEGTITFQEAVQAMRGDCEIS